MPKITMYSTAVCPYCQMAERLLRSKGVAEIDKILLEVRARRMPLPPYRSVTASEIERIEGWKSSGFRE